VALGHSSLVVGFDDDGGDQPFHGLVVGEDTDDIRAALDLPVQAL